MTAERITVENDVRPEDKTFLNDRLYEFNTRATGIDDGRSLAVFARD